MYPGSFEVVVGVSSRVGVLSAPGRDGTGSTDRDSRETDVDVGDEVTEHETEGPQVGDLRGIRAC